MKLNGNYDGPCEFCDGKIRIRTEQFSVEHTLPTCATYEKFDAMQFVVETRRTIEAKKTIQRGSA
jgi:hypothetical protein